MAVIARDEPIYVCPSHGMTSVRGAIEGPWPECIVCGARVNKYVRADVHQGAVAEVEKWKRIAQDRCTCVATCGDTPEESGGVCKKLPHVRGQYAQVADQLRAESDVDRLRRHVGHEPISIVADGLVCAQCGVHVVQWGAGL